MLKNILWSDYIVTVSAIFFLYYLYISVRYYSDEIKGFLSGKQKQNFIPGLDTNRQNNTAIEQARDEHISFENHSDNQFDETEQLVERLKSVIADATKRQLIPQEFKQYLSMVLKEYPAVKNSSLRASVNELIISECEKYGTVTLKKEEEVDVLWKDSM